MSMTPQMRLSQQLKLAPRMIQSMEVLQLPLLALQEKIEMELNSNPVLEQFEDADEDSQTRQEQQSQQQEEALEDKELVVNDDSNNVEDFQRLDSLGDDNTGYDDYMEKASSLNRSRSRLSGSGDPDRKLQAIQNTAALERSLNDNLIDQWRLVEADDNIKTAGSLIIDYIDRKGYMTVRIEQLYNKDRHNFGIETFYKALALVQKLDPSGVGARDLRECLLIQIAQRPEDMSFERLLIENHMDQLLENKLPQIAKKMKCSVEQINTAIRRLSKLDTSPGLQVGRDENHPITADVIAHPNGNGNYLVHLVDTHIPNLRVNNFYSQMSKSREINAKTREFLQQNIRSAQWLMDAIQQRKQTLLKVASVIVAHQSEFFEKGKLHLKPLPMALVAEQVGVHIATISRAVAGKYIQCSQGVLPLRGFFSGGTDDTNGKSHSWDAIRAKLQQIVDAEDKAKPLNDDQLRDKLIETGIENIARRTVAKYRKLLNIPAARFRKKYYTKPTFPI